MMKSALVMSVAGTGLFAGTVFGLLAVQGRLNFEGTRGLPLVETLFTEPDGGHDSPDARPVEVAEMGHHAAPPGGSHDDGGHAGERVDGLGRESALPRALGPEVPNVGGEGATPVGRPENPSGEHGEEGHESDHGSGSEHEDSHGASHDTGHGGGHSAVHPADVLMGQDQYRRGKLFEFPRLDSGMSVTYLNELLANAREREQELSRREAVLEEREAGLKAREEDLQQREASVLVEMRRVKQARTEFEDEVAAFQRTVTMVRGSEVAQFQQYADTLATLDTAKASQIIVQMWGSVEGKTKATKILKLMAAEPRQELLGTLDPQQTQDILDRLTGAVVETKK